MGTAARDSGIMSETMAAQLLQTSSSQRNARESLVVVITHASAVEQMVKKKIQENERGLCEFWSLSDNVQFLFAVIAQKNASAGLSQFSIHLFNFTTPPIFSDLAIDQTCGCHAWNDHEGVD